MGNFIVFWIAIFKREPCLCFLLLNLCFRLILILMVHLPCSWTLQFNLLLMGACWCALQLIWQSCVGVMGRFAIPSKILYYLYLHLNYGFEYVSSSYNCWWKQIWIIPIEREILPRNGFEDPPCLHWGSFMSFRKRVHLFRYTLCSMQILLWCKRNVAPWTPLFFH